MSYIKALIKGVLCPSRDAIGVCCSPSQLGKAGMEEIVRNNNGINKPEEMRERETKKEEDVKGRERNKRRGKKKEEEERRKKTGRESH